ncbi:unnamed protein product [Allacma fusca]|uniref:Uncharacterized protein n=1 Tax=Allacma fusca TaxID=39272 RepID=A0A8J2JUI8_9HEXA|nr:unnamed protein product [Allacma fusca]
MRLKKKLASRPPRPPCRSLSSTPTPTSSSVNGSSSNPKTNFVRSRTVSPSPTPRPPNCTCSCNCTSNYNNVNNNNNYYNNHQSSYPGSESETEDYNPPAGPNPRSYSPWPENFDPYDPYAYMQWYYWWYYNYGYPMGWNGYDYSSSRSATPNPNSATESSQNYKSDSEQSEKNYYSQSEDTEETLQSVARNISNYKFGAEENNGSYSGHDERQGSVPRIIVNRSPDPSSPANAPQFQYRDELLKANNDITQQQSQNETKYMENSRKPDLVNKEFKSYQNTRNCQTETAEMEARQRMLQEIRSREMSKSNGHSYTDRTTNQNSTKSELKSTEKPKFDAKPGESVGTATKPHHNTLLDPKPDESHKYNKKFNDFSKFDVKSYLNSFAELQTNETSLVDANTSEKSAFSLTSNEKLANGLSSSEKSTSDIKPDSKYRSDQTSNGISKADLTSNQKPRFDVKANENGRYEVKINENGRFDLKSNENSRFEIQNSRLEIRANEKFRNDTRTNENSRIESKANESARNHREVDQRSASGSSLLDSLKLTASVCDTEANQKSVKLESNEESESELTKSDVLYCSRTPEPGQSVIRNSHTRETVLPTTPSSSSFSSSSSELFSEREDNYFDCREDRGYYEESDADIFRPYTSAGLVREDIVEVDENTKGGRSNVGFIEEPEADTSEEDAPTLVDEAAFNPGVTIEECYSSEEMTPDSKDQFAYPTRPPTRLSTIDELTERSRTTFPILDEEDLYNYKDDEFQDTVEDLSEDEESNDENSSVSVIENKSDGHIDWGATTGGESHADEASTSSSDAEDENDDDPLLPTVTVQLPLNLSFSKTRSFRDIPAALAGSSKEDQESKIATEVPQPKEPKEKFTYQSGNHDIEELSQSEEYSCDDAKAGLIDEAQTESEFSVIENCIIESEVEDEPVVSFTISLSRSTSKKYEDDSECGDDLEVDQEPEESFEMQNPETEINPNDPEIDFWGEIQKSEDSSETSHHDHDFWKVLQPEATAVTSDDNTSDDVLTNSSAPATTNAEESNFWDRGRTFGTKAFSRQFSWDLHDEDDLEESKTSHNVTAGVKQEPKVPEASVPRTETKNEKDSSEQHHSSETKSEKIASETKSQRNSSETKLERRTSETKSERSTSESLSERCTSETRSERSTAENKSERNSVELKSLKSEDKETKTTEEIKTSCEKTKVTTKESSTETKITENQTKYKNSTETTEEVRMRNKEKSSTCKMDTIFSNRKLDDCDFSSTVRNNHVTNDQIKSYRHSIGKIPFTEENSDESTDCETKQEDKIELKRTTSLTKKEINERNIEIKETRENFRVRPSSLNFELNQAVTQPDAKKTDSKTESVDLQKMARAEDLLWRIERFLQESLSLGSEDDSGVMTDISRQISDVDTDNDVETEVVTRNKTDDAINRAARALKTQSLIETAAEIKAYEKVDTSNVTLRNFSLEKKSLRYQRAKTHSRLFQLLQDECHKDGDDEVDVILEESIDFENLEQVEAAIEKKNDQENKRFNRKAISDQKDRFLPDKMKGNLTSSTSVDSTSSSSGVLSPSSPVSRDQLLVDIINGISSAKKKGANFPSKIFKLLQQKFGEEFYDTFECCEDDFDFPSTPSTDTPQPSFFENRLKQRTATPTREISHNKSLEESENKRGSSWKKDLLEDSCSNSNKNKTEFLQVPPRRKKSILNRDPRVPKPKATPKV